MSHRYLLDTDTLSAMIKRPTGPVTDHLKQHGASTVCTSVVVAGELRFGARKAGSTALTERVEKLLEAIDVLPLAAPTSQTYAAIRATLEKRGNPIGPNDLWIAAHALGQNLTVVTGNQREFSRVAGLKLENWLD